MIFFDIDNTLVDYNVSEKKVIEKIFLKEFKMTLNDEQIHHWHIISQKIFDKRNNF